MPYFRQPTPFPGLGERYITDEEPEEDRPPRARTALPPTRMRSGLGGPPGFAQAPACTPAAGIPNTNCSAYAANRWWLPAAYVNNATCACRTTPNAPTANCVRQFLQNRLAATPRWFKLAAAAAKAAPATYPAFVQATLTPRIYRDHVDAYRACCCPSGPAPYWSWIGVTTVPIQPCSLVGHAIRQFGPCHGVPGRW